jgi:TPR repeat protein
VDALSDPAVLAEAIRVGVREHADAEYVAGTVAARHPGKPVLGVRIPLLRGAVRAALRRAVPKGAIRDETLIRGAADVLWHGDAHEDELAACMLLRLADVAPTAELARRWASGLDNWSEVGRTDRAIQLHKRAIDLGYDAAMTALANIYWTNGDRTAAKGLYFRAVSIGDLAAVRAVSNRTAG